MQEADAAENPPPAGEDGDADLDAEQQKAFESIMSQIEDGGAGDTESGAEAPRGVDAEADAEDDFSAELERVVQEADAAENPPPAGEDGDSHLDADPQKAFESTTDLIEADHTEKAASDSGKSASVDPDEEYISGDIKDLLKEIGEDRDQLVSGSGNDDALEKTVVGDDIVTPEKEKSTPVKGNLPEIAPPAGKREKSAQSEKDLSSDTPPDHPQTPKKSPAAGLQSPQAATPLREASSTTGSHKKKALMASAVVILFLTLAGCYYWTQIKAVDSAAPLPVPDTSVREVVVKTEPLPEPKEPVVVDYGPSDESRLKKAAQALDQLRNELIVKQAEIEELRSYYQAGIDAEIQGVVDTVRKAGKTKINFEAAMANPRISLGLTAIQRRDTYIRKLETPVNSLFRNNEELLFFSRKAGLLALMAAKTSDIDIDGFIEQVDEISDAHRMALSQLNIDAIPASPPALESIWKEITKRISAKPVKVAKNHTAIETANRSIWKNICDGDFTGKNRLTVLSPEASRCLSTWEGKDLFLNALIDLSPQAARHLAEWEGDWLGLNGLTDLSPEAAAHLARWKGNGLSLNGLSRLSPRLVSILSEWQGDQLELVNVKHMAHWENPKTRLFLSEELKRKRVATRN